MSKRKHKQKKTPHCGVVLVAAPPRQDGMDASNEEKLPA